ncbi:sulfotransferase domain-containing protein [Bythopirellula goksoeyrii]|uniref:Sulfotransferase domain protein n=1 Tax=Bythopirellula goksoeyrii TaxID=1400387 RepID=A0A5B9QKU8_9BACT|nr:sulfotransferase domain-containing protein [Bythopirellula goksoeyrii]QEG34751.1 Sulfotransferase domain protein [Bythopirellula goksoeyrii]
MTNILPTVVVSGPPRSGTSLMMQMLLASGIKVITDGERAEDDNNPRGYFEHKEVMRLAQDKSIFHDSAGKAVKVIHALLKHIPVGMPLAVIFLERDLDEVLASQSVMLERLGRPQAKIAPQRMRDILESQLTLVRKELEARTDTSLLEVKYAQLIADPTATAKQIAAFLEPVLGRQLDYEAMAACVDASLYRQKKA